MNAVLIICFVVGWLVALMVERDRCIDDTRFVDPFDGTKVLG